MHEGPRPQQLQRNALQHLEWGLQIIQNHQGALVYKKQSGNGKGQSLLVTFHLPGVLKVTDAQTGELLAESAPGNPLTLRQGFTPAGQKG